MRRFIVLPVLVIAAVAVAAVVIAQGRDGGTASPTLEEAKTGVGRVETLNCDGTPFNVGGHDFTGSGFLIGSRLVMSVEHGMWVAQGRPACKMRVRFGDESYPVTNVRVWGEPGHKDMYERRGVDLATLTLARPVEDRHVFRLASEGAPKGASVSTAGYPLGGPLKVSSAPSTATSRTTAFPPSPRIDIEGGSSGSPIFTDQGEVVSVVSRIVISGSLTRDKSNRNGGIDLPRWWGPDVLADLCRVYGDSGIPNCEDHGGHGTIETKKRSVVLLPKKQ